MPRPRSAGGDHGDLVIVESPAKAKTIERYLGPGYRVLASYGHVRDLPAKALGVDLDHDFAPRYEPLKDRRRERDIGAFGSEGYWSRAAELRRAGGGAPFTAELSRIDGGKVRIGSEAEAHANEEALRGERFTVQSVTRSERRKSAPPPFTTST